ncbi:hypothetical protein PSMK_31440 [Phycisphaera mikurensis NBRC 102666]|uniref:Uncharacterized protein n=2 Tax=Phycisphaera TaxID=666508 RepID=I0IJ65_PHYMF|nr:hypothetical protein PSMK_31440 [Phycisphaera mikurensis NBRC 102666]
MGGQPPEGEEILAGFDEAFPLLCFTATRMLLGRRRGLFFPSCDVTSVHYREVAGFETLERGGVGRLPLLVVRDTGGVEHDVMPGGRAHLHAAAACLTLGVESTT